jgi:hypothetical protein
MHVLQWGNLNDRHINLINQLWFNYKILKNHSAPNHKNRFIPRETNPNNYNLGNAHTNPSIPKPNIKYLKTASCIAGGGGGAVYQQRLNND